MALLQRNDIDDLCAAFRRDGVVFVPGLLDAQQLATAQRAFDWSLEHPGPLGGKPYAGTPGEFYQDLCHPNAALNAQYQDVLHHTPIAPLIARLWGTKDIWFMYEQIFLKEGGEARRTPWHQDTSYLSVDGEHLAVVWITFDRCSAEDSLEFVVNSHRGTLYNTSAFAASDDTTPIFDGLPILPDIEADRSKWPIVSWAVEPGDAVIFHPSMLHGGAPTREGTRRRTLSLRYFGTDAVFAKRPGPYAAPHVPGLSKLQPGEPFRNPAFPNVSAVV